MADASARPADAAGAWPVEIRLVKDRCSLVVTFEDGVSHTLPAEYLRVMSPSAEVQGHGPTQKKTIPGKSEVAILAVEPVGHYAIKLVFDDLHDTGIYGWDLLRDLGEKHAENWAAYLAELHEKGLSREATRRGGAAPR